MEKNLMWSMVILNKADEAMALPITRLTSLKSLCTDEIAARQFTLYLSQRVQQQMNQAEPSQQLTLEKWLST